MNIVPAIADKFLATGRVSPGFIFAPEPGIIGFWAGWFGASVFVFESKGDSTE